MTRWLFCLPLLLACSEPTAPAMTCQGAIEVTIHVHRFGSDTAVVCTFPTDSTPPVQPPDTGDGDDDGHHHDHHHGEHR